MVEDELQLSHPVTNATPSKFEHDAKIHDHFGIDAYFTCGYWPHPSEEFVWCIVRMSQ